VCLGDQILKGIVMPNREIYLLSPKELSPETIAVAFAKTSRSPESFREIAAGLTEEKSAQFHEKWVVGYGHASVAEHAVLHVAFENVSRLAIESIESNRLASYTEKSTRYQKWGLDNFFIPSELDDHPLRVEYINTCQLLFRTYHDSLEPVRTLVLKRAERRENESEEALDRRVRSKYVDTCRFLLPAAALANLGMTANARVLENMIRKMLSSELSEVHQIGEQVKAVAKREIPTLVKYADAAPYITETARKLQSMSRFPTTDRTANVSCALVDYDKEGEKKILAAAMYRFGEMSLRDTREYVKGLPDSEWAKLAKSLLQDLGEHDIPIREFEYSTYTFDLVMDQGAYAEFKRHRMMTQSPQALTTRLGYAIPRLIMEAGFEVEYRRAMDSAAELYEKLHEFNPEVAQYIVPNGYNRRVLTQFNLREAYHFCQLRAAANAHYSIRRIAYLMHQELLLVHPTLTGFMHLPEETGQSVEEKNFSTV
jgi:thymidylate synthase ThyX